MNRTLLAAAILGTLAGAASAADVVREGTGPRRAALDAMELQPFPAGAWDTLGSWTAKPEDMSGKVVLIGTWASWYPLSVREGLTLAGKMQEKYAEQGLIVVVVHGKDGWAEGAPQVKDAKFAYAHDAEGKFQEALKIDQAPDFYLIDRAGHLRYADVVSASVEEAVKELLAETREQADDLPRIRRERLEQLRAKQRATGAIREFQLEDLPPVPPGYVAPAPEAYTRISWPRMDEQQAKDFGMKDNDGNDTEVRLNLAPTAWHPSQPEMAGRAAVVYLWHPDVRLSYADVLLRMDTLQRQHKRDLVVIGALTPMSMLDQQGNRREEDTAKLTEKLETFLRSRKYEHTIAGDFGGTAISSFSQNRAFPLPGAMVISSDGVIRWVGLSGSPEFQSAVDRVLLVDPGIKLRRAAEQAYIASQGK